ncbi:MAG TPA: hypothetical protein VEA41_20080 [Salinarimonas sp.]|jgi:hypothetical protein|nr:hypothetical protein [Salinarimonas sp.]
MADGSGRTKRTYAVLDAAARERLGRELRTALDADEAKPAFLGDPALPPDFDEPVRRLHRARKAHETGVAAVERALSGIAPPQPDDEGGKAGGGT